SRSRGGSAADHHQQPDNHRQHQPSGKQDGRGDDRAAEDRPYGHRHGEQARHGQDRRTGPLAVGHLHGAPGRTRGRATELHRPHSESQRLRAGEAGPVRQWLVQRLLGPRRRAAGRAAGSLSGAPATAGRAGVGGAGGVVVVIVAAGGGQGGRVDRVHRVTFTLPISVETSRVSTGPAGSSGGAGQSTLPTSTRQFASTASPSGSCTRTSPTSLEML